MLLYVQANGENILGAQPGTEEPIREKGTSYAAPIVTGISALLMSLQLQRGEQPNAEAKPLIWTLNQELTPIYALEPVSGFAADIYETLILMLEGQIQPENSDDFVERVSVPARLTDRIVGM